MNLPEIKSIIFYQNNYLYNLYMSSYNNKEVILPLASFIGITGLVLFRDKEKIKLLNQLLTDKVFMASIICIIIFSVYQLNQTREENETDGETDRRKRATIDAILGLIIAILMHLDIKLGPFFIIWITSYYFGK
tara:strand:+ start:781 stop:1182 length:402 start_codon:yes stop_codon:yes gene_type:complete